MDERLIQEALDQLRFDRRNGIAPDEALSDATQTYSLALAVLRNRYRVRFEQEIEETPPPVQPIALPTIRNSCIKEARRMAGQFQRRQRYLDPAFYNLNGVIARIGRHDVILAGVFLRSREVMTVYLDDYELETGNVQPGPHFRRRDPTFIRYFIGLPQSNECD